ncbi:MAG: C40 family peptidase [Flavobacterium sp.]|nr:C40 family peptidase [Flavobacterium sp.]
MRKIIGFLLISLIVISCKTQAILQQEVEETEEAGDFEIKLNIAYKDSVAKANKEKVVVEKNTPVRKIFKDKEKRKFAAIVEDIDIFLTRARVIDSAKTYIGTPYHYGGMSINGIDCSALMYRAFQKNNLTLPRTSLNKVN